MLRVGEYFVTLVISKIIAALHCGKRAVLLPGNVDLFCLTAQNYVRAYRICILQPNHL